MLYYYNEEANALIKEAEKDINLENYEVAKEKFEQVANRNIHRL